MPLRDACKAAAAAAASAWGREIGADAAEKIFERCSDAYGTGKAPKLGRYSLAWRKAQAPTAARDLAPVDLAVLLLRHGGRWPSNGSRDWAAFRGDPELTAGALADYLRNRLKLKIG